MKNLKVGQRVHDTVHNCTGKIVYIVTLETGQTGSVVVVHDSSDKYVSVHSSDSFIPLEETLDGKEVEMTVDGIAYKATLSTK